MIQIDFKGQPMLEEACSWRIQSQFSGGTTGACGRSFGYPAPPCEHGAAPSQTNPTLQVSGKPKMLRNTETLEIRFRTEPQQVSDGDTANMAGAKTSGPVTGSVNNGDQPTRLTRSQRPNR